MSHGNPQEMTRAVRENMEQVRYKIAVLSGKGGVGKSTVAANLAAGFAAKGMRTALLDADLHGPSIPGLVGIKGQRPNGSQEDRFHPVQAAPNLQVMSIGLILETASDAVIWRGPMKHSVISQLLSMTEWGQTDVMVIDFPPGTGDEPLAALQQIGDVHGGGDVTTPQTIAVDDVRRSVTFCEKMGLPVLGIIENMSGFKCPHCGEKTEIFGSGGGQALAQETNVEFLGRVPIDPAIREAGDSGKPHVTAGHDENHFGDLATAIMQKLNV
jgi:Mrp family chromosome partitioning ATPase